MQDFPDYTEIIEKLARDGDHFDAIKSIDEIAENFDSLDVIEKYNLDALKATCLIETRDFSNAFKILKKMDPEFEDTDIATLKMKSLVNVEQLENAVQISKHIMENDNADWRDNIDFLLESYRTWGAYWSEVGEGGEEPNEGFTWEACTAFLEVFLKRAMKKNSKNIDVLVEMSTTLSMMAGTEPKDQSEKLSYNDRCKIMDDARDHLLIAEHILKNSHDSKKRAYVSNAWYIYHIQKSSIEEDRKNPNKDDVLQDQLKALGHLTYTIKKNPGSAIDWYNKSDLENSMKENQKAFYSAMVAFNLHNWDDNDNFQAVLEELANKFNEEQKSQLLDIKKIRRSEIQDIWK